jgi:hypothetical protein
MQLAFNNIFQAFVKRNLQPGEFGLSSNKTKELKNPREL